VEVSELRKRILRALEDAKKDAVARRQLVDEATALYRTFLDTTAVPLMRQAALVLNATGPTFTVHTPAGSVRLQADKSPQTFVELVLDTSRQEVVVLGRTSVMHGRDVQVVERPLASGQSATTVTEADLAEFLVAEIPRLVVRS